MAKFNRRDFMAAAGVGALGLGLGHNSIAETMGKRPAGEIFDPWLEIDPGNMARNLKQIQERVGSRPVMAVIKANGYGHGVRQVGWFLERQGLKHLAVGKVAEAVQLREAGVKAMILNFGPISRDQTDEIVDNGVSQSVYTPEAIEYLVGAAKKLNKKAKVHIKVDTGLGRVGVPYYEAGAFIEKAAREEIEIEGVFTTLTEEAEFDLVQLDRFANVCQGAKKKGIAVGLQHAASSASIFSEQRSYLDMVRPGITIYGQYPSTAEYEAKKLDLRPVMSLKTRVILVKKLRPGDSVSYHRAFKAHKETLVATLPIGYSDGYPYQAAQKGEVIIGGRRWPIIASVSANHTMVNVTGAEGVKIGDEAVMMGKQGEAEITAEELAAWAGSSVYKIVIEMNPLLPRVYSE